MLMNFPFGRFDWFDFRCEVCGFNGLFVDWLGDTLLVNWINLLFGALFWLLQAHPLFILLNVISCEVQIILIGWLSIYHPGKLPYKRKIKSIIGWFQWHPSRTYDYFTRYYETCDSISEFNTYNFLFYILWISPDSFWLKPWGIYLMSVYVIALLKCCNILLYFFFSN